MGKTVLGKHHYSTVILRRRPQLNRLIVWGIVREDLLCRTSGKKKDFSEWDTGKRQSKLREICAQNKGKGLKLD